VRLRRSNAVRLHKAIVRIFEKMHVSLRYMKESPSTYNVSREYELSSQSSKVICMQEGLCQPVKPYVDRISGQKWYAPRSCNIRSDNGGGAVTRRALKVSMDSLNVW
jgi:hypothetical protein